MNASPITKTVLLIALASAALAAGDAAAEAAPAAQCPKGKTAWKLDGRSACAPRAALGGAVPTSAGPASARSWLVDASRAEPGGRFELPPSLRRTIPRVGSGLERLAARAVSPARGAQHGPVVNRMEKVVARMELGDGAFAESRLRAREHADGSYAVEGEVNLVDGKGNTVRYTPDLEGLGAPDEPVGCPTAAGVVAATTSGSTKGSVVRLRGRRVTSAKTVEHSWRIEARGQVGTDARLASVAAQVTLTITTFERGVRQRTTLSAPVSLSRDGAPRVSGTPSVDVGLRVASMSRSEEREAEAELARALVGMGEASATLGSMAVLGRTRLLDAEAGWYDLPNGCAQIDWDPNPPIAVESGATRRVTGRVIAQRDGGVATGTIAIAKVGPGQMTPIGPAFSPAGPATFDATGGMPNGEGYTVNATAIATSTAGRAERPWVATGTSVSLPLAFRGTVAATTTTAGLKRTFSGSAAFTRTSVVRGPDGSLTAWYELTSASLNQAKETLGATEGCRIEANATGGVIDSGDLELRVLPGGVVVYALLYDLKAASVFAPTDCPPGSGDPFEGDVSAFLNTRRPGPVESHLRPAGVGYALAADQVQDVTGLQGTTTTATWSLVPE